MTELTELHEPILHVVRTLRSNPASHMTLNDMADMACLSQFHFHRQFVRAVGNTPGEFLMALRLELAKKLLLSTNNAVVDICFDVGYSSPGTFNRRFTHLVGTSPERMRRLATRFADHGIADLENGPLSKLTPYPVVGLQCGTLICPPDFQGICFVGLFSRRIAQSVPVAGTITNSSGPFTIEDPPDGTYNILAAAVPSGDNAAFFSPGDTVLVGVGDRPLRIQHRDVKEPVCVRLRSLVETDAPVVVSMPVILARSLPHLVSAA